uniref:Uncharacterized protein n=1 Tax=Rhinolophus ferrumequinum TaxID=59479 RepID=A0A671FX13_RHIFE
MEDSHKNNTSETARQPGSTVQGAHISHIAQQWKMTSRKLLAQLEALKIKHTQEAGNELSSI